MHLGILFFQIINPHLVVLVMFLLHIKKKFICMFFYSFIVRILFLKEILIIVFFFFLFPTDSAELMIINVIMIYGVMILERIHGRNCHVPDLFHLHVITMDLR